MSYATECLERGEAALTEAYTRIDALEAQLAEARKALEEIGEYTGEGPTTTPWQAIVKDVGEIARSALNSGEKPT